MYPDGSQFQLNPRNSSGQYNSINGLVMSNNGNVGIGKNPNTYDLSVLRHIQVFGDSFNVMGLFSANYGEYIHVGAWEKTGSSSRNIVLNQFGGRVGIGKSNPGETLDVAGSAALRGKVFIGASDSLNYIRFYGIGGDGPGNFNHTVIAERKYDSGESSELILFKGNDLADRVRILAAGGLVVDAGVNNFAAWDPDAGAPPASTNPNSLFVGANGFVGIS